MNTQMQTWAVVLAAGSGTRLSSLTVGGDGAAVPKQYCSLTGGGTLLDDALQRAAGVGDPARIAAVVAAGHRRWWLPVAGTALDRDRLFEQPRNRGTAIGVLLAALHVHQRAHDAAMVFLPSDHYVRDERVLATSIALGRRNP
jgi:mannose-1-phosphate guanylyltransferase